jgi:hypothetical protein
MAALAEDHLRLPRHGKLPIALARGEIDMISGAWTGWKNWAEVTRRGQVDHPVRARLS